jgi:hypothetical protein
MERDRIFTSEQIQMARTRLNEWLEAKAVSAGL